MDEAKESDCRTESTAIKSISEKRFKQQNIPEADPIPMSLIHRKSTFENNKSVHTQIDQSTAAAMLQEANPKVAVCFLSSEALERQRTVIPVSKHTAAAPVLSNHIVLPYHAHSADSATSRAAPPPVSPTPGTLQFEEKTIAGNREKLIAYRERDTFAILKSEAGKIDEGSKEDKLRGKKRVATTTINNFSPVAVKKLLPNPIISIPTFTGSVKQSIFTPVSDNASLTPHLDENSIQRRSRSDLVIGQNSR